MTGKSLVETLREYGASRVYPMHMPGHKRNTQLLGDWLPWQLDITEVNGFDDLHEADGILAEGMRQAAALYQSQRAFYLVNGSSCGILAAIRTAVSRGGRIVVARNCHKSVYHAIEINDLQPVYLTPPWDEAFHIWGSVTAEQVETALAEHPDTELVVLTSPTYEGVVSDIESIAGVVHSHGVPLLVDEAHGAHLGFSQGFPRSAVSGGADIVIQSLHKTLPSLTQTALAHVSGSLVDGDEMARQLAIFESSSPSYLFLASIDRCVSMLYERESREKLFSEYEQRLARFSESLIPLRNLRVLCHGSDGKADHPVFFDYDPGKVVVSTAGTQMTGGELSQRLREEFQIEMEMASADFALAMTSVCDTDEGFSRLSDALLQLDGQCSRTSENGAGIEKMPALPPAPQQVMTIGRALSSRGSVQPLEISRDRISQEYVWAYPPGIPLLTPGQRVSSAVVEAIQALCESGVELHSTARGVPHSLRVLEENFENS